MASTDILETIAAQRRIDIAEARTVEPESVLWDRAARTGFSDSATPAGRLLLDELVGRRGPLVAAEFKRASPSKGLMVDAALPAAPAALAYAEGGAALVSVLTEPKWFKGSLDDLSSVRVALQEWAARTGRPRPAVLRKDFIIDSYQVAEAAAAGADTLLLIVALLPTVDALRPLIDVSRRAGMEPLVEVVSTAELDVALAAGARVIGVNNRNLRTFTVDLKATASVVAAAALHEWRASCARSATSADGAPVSVTVLSLSGLRSGEDIPPLVADCEAEAAHVLAHARAHAGAGAGAGQGAGEGVDTAALARWLVARVLGGVLVGEALMRAADPVAAVAAFAAAATSEKARLLADSSSGSSISSASASAGPSTGSSGAPLCPLVKICGVRCVGDALMAAQCGASLVGMIMVEGSPRYVSPTGDGAAIVKALKAFREQDPSAALAQLQRPAAAAGGLAGAAAALAALSDRATALRAAARRARPLAVGVFMDAPRAHVLAAAAAAGLDLVQLHGKEDPAEWAAHAHAGIEGAVDDDSRSAMPPFIKVLHVPVQVVASEEAGKMPTTLVDEDAAAALADAVCKWATAGAAAILLDSAVKGSGSSGGNGLSFDHESVLRTLASALAARTDSEPSTAQCLPVFVAGGLVPSNVARCIDGVRRVSRLELLGVDVSSGVEADGAPKGTKDPSRVAAFISAAKYV